MLLSLAITNSTTKNKSQNQVPYKMIQGFKGKRY